MFDKALNTPLMLLQETQKYHSEKTKLMNYVYSGNSETFQKLFKMSLKFWKISQSLLNSLHHVIFYYI